MRLFTAIGKAMRTVHFFWTNSGYRASLFILHGSLSKRMINEKPVNNGIEADRE